MTFLELIIVTVIIAIIASLAIPFYISLMKRWEAKQTSSKIINAYRLSKSSSLLQHQNVIMCLADTVYSCDKNAKDMLLIFTDNDNNKQFDANQNKLLLASPLNLDYGSVHLRTGGRGGRNYIKFFGDTGLPRGHFGHIKYCPFDGSKQWMYEVSINKHGIHTHKTYVMKDTQCPSTD